jgi:hypothetical protein
MIPIPLLGGIIEAVGKVAGDLITTDKERLAAQLEAAKIEARLVQGQLEINKVEAANSNVFVSGWRPGIGWVGVAAMAYQFLLYPLLVWAWSVFQAIGWVPMTLTPPPMLDTDALWVILSGMLGIAGMRTVEKVKKVAS